MALSTKLNLINAKFCQGDGGLLTLSGDTRIHDVGTLQYTSNQSGSYVARSVPDVAYVTGLTGNLDGRVDNLEAWSATTETRVDNLEADMDNLAAWSATTETRVDNLEAWSATTETRVDNLEAWSATTETRVDNLEADMDNLAAWSGGTQAIVAVAITGVTNGLTKVGSHDAKIGGQLNETTTVYGSQTLNFNVNTLNLTGATGGIRLSGTTYLAVMSGIGNLLCFNTSTGQIGRTSLSAFGGITGGTNGIIDAGDYNLGLGGALSQNTTICGAGFDLNLGTVASKLDAVNIIAAGTTTVCSGTMAITSSGATFTDVSASPAGIQYNSDYSTTFQSNSLVTKCYVDSVATGLNPHTAVCVTTTANIDLNGTETIDGIALIGGERVLVKDQTAGWQNGIYTVNAGGAWPRATDYDFSPSGEIANGDLIPVTSGTSQAHTAWILTTPNPITSGDTLTFTMFSQLMGISAGNGISVTAVGDVQTVSVKLGANSGLAVDTNGLCVNTAIAGHGLTMTAGVINADVVSGGTVSSIPVRYNVGDTQLVINCADITAAVGAITGAENGLHVTSGGNVSLGGVLTGATTITGNDSCTLTYTDTAITDKRGILYGDDYSTTFVSNSLVSAKYVTGLTGNLDERIDNLEAWSATTETRVDNLEAWSATTETRVDNLEAWSATTETRVDNLEAWSATTETRVDNLETWSGTSQLIIANAITNVTNGLTKVGAHGAMLGGQLTGATTIYGSQALNFNITTFSVTGTSAINLNSPSIVLTQVPPAGSTADSVLVRDSTGQIQVVAGSVLGDHNNIYSYTAVTGTVTLTTGSSYVIMVTAPATVTLPNPAQDGQVFKIKDVAGTALTTNISIVGTIDGAANALINTNYGALELMYTGGAWYSLAFIN